MAVLHRLIGIDELLLGSEMRAMKEPHFLSAYIA